MVTISMVNKNDFVEGVKLDGVSYKIRMSWNDLAAKWMLDLRTADNIDIVKGIAVVPNFPLLAQHKRENVPRGELMAVCTNDKLAENQEIPRDGFCSGRFSLIYIPEAEINAL